MSAGDGVLLGQTVALTALLDTGNSLRDTAGEPVLTAELSRFPQLAAAIQHRPPSEALPMLRQRFPKLRPQLLPMRTAAGGGLLVSVSSDWTEIGGVRYPNLRIALTDTELGADIPLYGAGKGEGIMREWLRRLLCRLGLCREPGCIISAAAIRFHRR